MSRLKRLGARDVLRVLGGFGFEVVSIRGDHAKLVRVPPDGRREILVVPIKRRLAVGTLHAIYRQARRYVPEADLRPRFFAD